MAEVTRKNIIFTQTVKSATTITEETIDEKIIDEIFPEVDDNERVGCVDINALNLCSDCVGCYNENKIPRWAPLCKQSGQLVPVLYLCAYSSPPHRIPPHTHTHTHTHIHTHQN